MLLSRLLMLDLTYITDDGFIMRFVYVFVRKQLFFHLSYLTKLVNADLSVTRQNQFSTSAVVYELRLPESIKQYTILMIVIVQLLNCFHSWSLS